VPRIRTERICGPYRDDTRREPWSVIVVSAALTAEKKRRRTVERFATEREAIARIKEIRQKLEGRTVSGAVSAYLAHKAHGVRESTLTTLTYRLHGILRTADGDRLLRDLKPQVAARLYQRRVDETKADTHRGELAAAGAFAQWCVRQGWIPSDPFAKVEPVGRRAAGKPQHRVDESRLFVDRALGECTTAGIAATCAVLMGLAASEVTNRVVRDVDDGGRLFWIDEGKTKNRRRHIIVPEVLRSHLAALARGRGADEPLFGYAQPRMGESRPVDRHWLGYHVRRLCEAAGVPVITPHSLRGLHGTLSVSAGIEVGHVARQLGHGGPGVTRRHYLAPGSEQAAGHERALAVIQGGKP
jgi:integrase